MSNPSCLIISPHYAPMETGLAHYCTLLHQEMQKNHQTGVLTSYTNSSGHYIYNKVIKWSFFSLRRVFSNRDLLNYDSYFVQYVPFMYAKRGGINFSFCFFILYLSLIKKKEVDLMVHEVNYPFEWRIKSSLMFFSHVCMMSILLVASRQVFTATDYFKELLEKYYFFSKGKITRLAVASNIPYQPGSIKMASKKLRISMFGKLHPAKETAWILKVCIELYKEGHSFEIIYIGESKDNLLMPYTLEEKEVLNQFLIPKGFLTDQEVSLELQKTDVFLAYFVDGLSARRGSVMAALQNGLEVISTKGKFTEKEFLEQSFIHLFPIDKEGFKDKLELYIASNQQKPHHSSSDRVIEFYQNNFSWSKVVKDYFTVKGGSTSS